MSRSVLLSLLGLCASCQQGAPAESPSTRPPLVASAGEEAAAPTHDTPTRHEVVLERIAVEGPIEGKQSVVWLYRPEPLPQRLGLIAIAPAGATPITGMSPAQGDRPEHEPYVRAGFAVISYSIAGERPAAPAALGQAMLEYRAGRAGTLEAKAAISLALERLPTVDPRLIFAAGHSSAGGHALLLAAEDKRVRAVAAYAPVTGLDAGLEGALREMEAAAPGHSAFLKWSMPGNRVDDITAPMLVVQSRLDGVVAEQKTSAFVAKAKKAGRKVNYVLLEKGDHYSSMIEEGLPRGLAWFIALRNGQPAR